MRRLLGYFVRGLVLVIPLAVTAYVCWQLFTTVDGWLGLPIRGAGFVVNIVLITLIGFFGSTLLTRSAFALFERLLVRLPFVRLLYSATKDLLNAFVGEKRRFDQPVTITLIPGQGIQMFGFVTQESLEHLGFHGMVSVYCPHSYAWAGQMFVVPAAQVQPLDKTSSDVMAFIVSGGVTGFPPAAHVTPSQAIPSTPEPHA